MLVFDAEKIRALATTPRLIEALREVFRTGRVCKVVRTVTPMPGGDGDRAFLSMLAVDREGGAVAKLLTIQPDNRPKGLLTVQGAVVVFANNGLPAAILDGTVLTQLRTGAASALASAYLSREDSSHLVIMGTGALAPVMATSHCAVRPIERISVWGRRADQANATANAIRALVSQAEVRVVDSIEAAVAAADIVSCSTSSATPVLAGKWLKPGAHVDLVGSFQPTKRESDDDVVRRARIFVDTFEGALHEGGDVVEPLSRGVITRDRIEGELADLAAGRVAGRTRDDEITLFKSVGTAIEDLAAARLVVEAAGGRLD
jgi:ornithine cyclodeaminase